MHFYIIILLNCYGSKIMAIGDSVAETLIKPSGLLARSCNPIQFPKSTSSLANLSRSVIPNASNYPKCRILSKVLEFIFRFYFYHLFPFSKKNGNKYKCLQNVLHFVVSLPVICTIDGQYDPNSCGKRPWRSCTLVDDRENSIRILPIANTRRLLLRK